MMPRKNNGKPPVGAKAARMRYAAMQHSARNSPLMAVNPAGPVHSFTMKDEARNTGQSTWSGEKLRNKPVIFVSAGMIEPSKELFAKDDAEVDTDSPEVEQPGDSIAEDSASAQPAADQPASHQPGASNPGQPRDGDAPGTKSIEEPATGGTRGEPGFFFDLSRDPSLAERSLRPAIIPEVASSAEESDDSEVILFKGRSNMARDKAAKKTQITLDEINIEIKAVETDLSLKSKPEIPSPPVNAPTGPRIPDSIPDIDHRYMTKAEEDAAIVADYIANMAEDSDRDQPYSRLFNHRDLGGDSPAFDAQDSQDQSKDEAQSVDDDDDDEGNDTDEPRNQSEEMEPESAIDDETLARLLSKQEEFGMGSDRLIFADTWNGGRTGATASSSGTPGQQSKQQKATAGRIPSAAAVADAFDDLDLMDWDRPSLQNFGKGKRGKPVFGVVDPDMEAHMQAAYANDREKKKQRKEEREELRSQGLLGKNANPDDLRVKYLTHMTLDNIKVELRGFLLSGEQLIQFPPMDKHARKILHDLSSKLNIKSNSTGSGDQRRATLTRTKRTPPFIEQQFEMVVARVGRKYFPRMDVKGKAPYQKSGGGRGNHSAVGYRDGEVVGASAPELGEDNKGRAMLEKMGWSSGMGLGSMDNKGILQPVAQVVKRTKAGLGQS